MDFGTYFMDAEGGGLGKRRVELDGGGVRAFVRLLSLPPTRNVDGSNFAYYQRVSPYGNRRGAEAVVGGVIAPLGYQRGHFAHPHEIQVGERDLGRRRHQPRREKMSNEEMHRRPRRRRRRRRRRAGRGAPESNSDSPHRRHSQRFFFSFSLFLFSNVVCMSFAVCSPVPSLLSLSSPPTPPRNRCADETKRSNACG